MLFEHNFKEMNTKLDFFLNLFTRKFKDDCIKMSYDCEELKFHPNQIILKEGKLPKFIYFIFKGEILVINYFDITN